MASILRKSSILRYGLIKSPKFDRYRSSTGVLSNKISPTLVLDFSRGIYSSSTTDGSNLVSKNLLDIISFTRAGTSTVTTSSFYLSSTLGQSFASRASTGTYFDSNGVLLTAEVDVARQNYAYVSGQWVLQGTLVEPQRTNIVPYSNAPYTMFNGTGASKLSVSITTPTGTAAAVRVYQTASSVYQSVFRAVTASASTAYAHSIYVKYDGNQWVYFQQFDGTTNRGAYFDVLNGVIGNTDSGVTASMTDVGSGWYRIGIIFTTGGSATVERIQLALVQSNGGSPTFTGDGTSGVYAWAAQLEEGSTVTSYIETTSASSVTRAADYYYPSNATYFGSDGLLKYATVNQPRFDYNPSTLAPRGLLVEGQRTNAFLYSSDLTNAVWVASSGSLVSGTSGTNFIPSTANSGHYFWEYTSVTSGTTYVDYIVVKANGYNYAQVALATGFDTVSDYVNFNLSNGTIGNKNVTGGSGFIQNYGIVALQNGYYLCWATATANATTATGRFVWSAINADTASRLPFFAGDGTSGINIIYAQREVGTFPTSYIPTTSAAATRYPDLPDILTLGNIGFNQAAGTIVAEYEATSASGSPFMVSLTTSNAGMYINTTAKQGAWDGSTAILTSNTVTFGSISKGAISWDSSGRSVVLNGGTVATDSNALLASPAEFLKIGHHGNNTTQNLNGWMRRIDVYLSRLSSTAMQRLTQ